MPDYVDQLVAFENGELDETETIELFQTLLDNGVLFCLQGFYGRLGTSLLESGMISEHPKSP